QYTLHEGAAVESVDSVMNYRVYGGRHIVAAVSGGVRVAASRVAADEVRSDRTGRLATAHDRAVLVNVPPQRWWWD
ncbi:MAG: hypothetical protein ACOC46_01730, partial [Pirellulales bacterium]